MGATGTEISIISHVFNQSSSESLLKNTSISRTLKSSLSYLKKVYRSTDLISLNYSESYAIGLDEFDHRRQMVVDVYNAFNGELRLLTKQAGSPSRLNDRASRLVRLIGDLLSFEEALMGESDYPGFDAHRAQHIRFLESLHAEFERIQAGHADMYDLSYLIGSWLAGHMPGMDKAFGGFFLNTVSELARARA